MIDVAQKETIWGGVDSFIGGTILLDPCLDYGNLSSICKTIITILKYQNTAVGIGFGSAVLPLIQYIRS
jgi:hypothetical protein